MACIQPWTKKSRPYTLDTFKASSVHPMEGTFLLRNLPEPVLLNIFTFLPVQSLTNVGATERLCRTLAQSNNIWRGVCLRMWPAMMSSLAPSLEHQKGQFWLFYIKNKRSLYESRRKKLVSKVFSRMDYFSDFMLMVDIRDSTKNKSVYSTAISLSQNNVKQLFKPVISESDTYEQGFTGFHYEGKQLDCQEVSSELFFNFVLLNKRTQKMASLGSGKAESSAATGYGPRSSDNALTYFGEGAEFLCALPLFGWFFMGNEDGKLVLHSLALEISYVDSMDHSERDENEILDCLFQIFENQLSWV